MAASAVLVKCARFFRQGKLLISIRMNSFQALSLNNAIIDRLANLGIHTPTEIQEKAIIKVSEGKNTIINAETGSGKTLCYLLPIVNRLMNEPSLLTSPPHALILLPTIELCHQVASVFKAIADPTMLPCIVSRDSKLFLKSNYPVVIAMPSSLLAYNLDTLKHIKVLIADEADLLTTSGGKDVWKLLNFFKYGKHIKKRRHWGEKPSQPVEQVVSRNDQQKSSLRLENNDSHLSPLRQFVFVAATLPSNGKKASFNVLKKWLQYPEVVTTSKVHQKLPTLCTEYVRVTDKTKLPHLLRCLNLLAGFLELGNVENQSGKLEMNSGPIKEEIENESEGNNNEMNSASSGTRTLSLRVLVFTNTAQQASDVYRYISNQEQPEVNADGANARGMDDAFPIVTGSKHHWRDQCAELHKNVPVEKRLHSLQRFKSADLRVLICTDIASRGLDIPDVSHVIQLDFSSNAAIYLHRTGRTARTGKQGKVINFLTPKDEDLARALRACDENPNNIDYEATFSRNRMFRRRIKGNKLALADSIP